MRCGADLDPKTLALGSLAIKMQRATFQGLGRHGLGVFAQRRIRKGQLVAAVPRKTLLQEPLASAEPAQRGAWYDVLGSEQGAASARRLAERIVEEIGASK